MISRAWEAQNPDLTGLQNLDLEGLGGSNPDLTAWDAQNPDLTGLGASPQNPDLAGLAWEAQNPDLTPSRGLGTLGGSIS